MLRPRYRAGPRSRTQRNALLVSIVSNLVMLGFFKYFNFGLDSYNAAMSSLGLDVATWHPVLRVVLPLGISFYTFQSLSYIIDVYRGDAKAMRNFVDFSCFVSMFPHLVAGPILQFSFLARQLEERSMTVEKFARGVALFSLGLGKKVLLANPCGHVADAVFDAGTAVALDAWYGAIAYAFQIYFDFSGYSDMAIGLGLMLGFIFAKNFDSPYKSASITEFWRRWHISLSSWLRDYLYISLGGSRAGVWRTYRNLILTMLLGGLWHGASWNFVIWGGLHGGSLAFERRLAERAVAVAPPSCGPRCGHVPAGGCGVGVLSGADTVRVNALLPKHAGTGAAGHQTSDCHRPHLSAVLFADRSRRWRRRVELSAGVGHDKTPDVAPRSGLHLRPLGCHSRALHAILQPIYLLHILRSMPS